MSAGSNMMDLIVFKMVDTTLTVTYTFMHPQRGNSFVTTARSQQVQVEEQDKYAQS